MKILRLIWALARGLSLLLWTLVKVVFAVGGIHRTGIGRRIERGLLDRSRVRVRRQWDDHRIGTVRWSDLNNLRWDTISGGMQVEAPQPFIHAYVWCDRVRGDIAHSCAHGPGPHYIKVCLVKKDNSKAVWEEAGRIVGSRPPKES